ncbi:hypothetical protein GUITHDRAFT_148030 [Guillardia theta CCMP2712]|uniref:Uncharacterized protein n=1 Tax=Guillardia theta (strain CCMP2712) TaxID=905079 RepID=L1IAQ0_GUITC|nr:hypothetical protein GUITHDRAFT_148030 [Guillardia theta CCMP2712]EKX33283.1 hypothetical protein GUITHDRAFT_148030 [Guillardia theta CCMP2712]|eukprot:XP_005820263.1 hypothetical protein GUITHDRAFT_148030 [Guillardia theta CCMP2712]
MFFDEEEDELLSEAPHSIFPGQSRCGGSQKKNKTETSCCSALGQPMELSACSSDLSHETAASCQAQLSPHGAFSSQALPMICERSSSFSGSRRSGRSRYQPLSLALANDHGAEVAPSLARVNDSRTYLLSPGQSAVYARRRAAKAALGSDGESMEEQKERKRVMPESEDYFGGEDESYPEPKPDYDEFSLIGKESPRYGVECQQLDELLLSRGELNSRQDRLEILTRLLEDDEAFYARVQSGELCKNLASFIQSAEVVELLIEGMLGMESLSSPEAKDETETSESSCIRPDQGNKISHMNSFHRLPALACELICGPHAYGSFCMKTIADSGALMRKVVHFLRYCTATVEQGSESREQDKQLVGQLEFHCMLWSRLCISFVSGGSDSPCLVKFLEALHADTRSFISCAHKLLWLPCVSAMFEQAVQADRERLNMWVESGVVSMLLSSLNGDPVEIDSCRMVAQQSCKKTCRAEAASGVLVSLLTPSGKGEALQCFEKEDFIACVLELCHQHTLQTPPIIAGLASRGSRVLCHLEDEEDEETCRMTLTADRPSRLLSGMQQHFTPSGLCALYLLNVFAQIQIIRENHPAGVQFETLLNHVAMRTLMLYKQSRSSCMIHLRAVDLMVHLTSRLSGSPMLVTCRHSSLSSGNATSWDICQALWGSLVRSPAGRQQAALELTCRSLSRRVRCVQKRPEGKDLILLLSASSVWPKVAGMGAGGEN